ncbi:hypothetical protein INR49_004098 [Caranx melampygus]|nr:hypothetical protein INR49_004098 [Caranx melampygus]
MQGQHIRAEQVLTADPPLTKSSARYSGGGCSGGRSLSSTRGELYRLCCLSRSEFNSITCWSMTPSLLPPLRPPIPHCSASPCSSKGKLALRRGGSVSWSSRFLLLLCWLWFPLVFALTPLPTWKYNAGFEKKLLIKDTAVPTLSGLTSALQPLNRPFMTNQLTDATSLCPDRTAVLMKGREESGAAADRVNLRPHAVI